MSQKGSVALVTSGASGLGKSFVQHLLAEGALVTICDLDNNTGMQVVDELSKTYAEKVIFMQCDVTKEEDFERCFKLTSSTFGGLDIAINNAGVADEWRKSFKIVVDTNLNGVINGTKLGVKYMSREKGGRGGIIVNVASLSAFQPCPVLPVYSATKAAVNQFSRSYGHDLFYKQSGVNVICINPGMSKSPLSDNLVNYLDSFPCQIEEGKTFVTQYPVQSADNVGKGLIRLLQKAESGSLWTIENDEPPALADLSKPPKKLL